MGVIGTFCQLCGIAVQHDHYVPEAGAQNRLKIYRGAAENGGHTWESSERPFLFGPQHQWLKRAVAVPYREGQPVLHGPVEDGDLAGVFVCNGNDEAWAVHEHCWEVLGQPTSHARELAPEASAAWRMVARYHEQLFAFRQLDDDGHGWMLVDPSGESADARRNAARILAMR